MADDMLFFFDFASPYGYFASRKIDALGAKHGRQVVWKPILLGAIFKQTGMQPNLQQPLRGDYFRHDCPRFARLLGVPFRMPESMPMNGVAASRAFYWLEERQPGSGRSLAQAVFHRHFVEGVDMSPVEAVLDALVSLGIDRAEATTALQSAAVKDRLRAEVQAAERLGVFGSPYILVEGEPFWGADRLDQIDHWLATGGW